MNKTMDILKISYYDKFKCIADKCHFTCCEGWDIGIDSATYNKWKNEINDSDNILKNVKIKKGRTKAKYFINKKTHETCPLLDEQGLCEIVKKHGEDYLSLTCHTFPRIENSFEGKKELTLSCACPEVVEIISCLTEKINMISENNADLKSSLPSLKIRETLINIIQQDNFLLEDKLIVSFHMLLSILENESFGEDSSSEGDSSSSGAYLSDELEKYKDKGYLQGFVDMFHELELKKEDSMQEINNLFLDITENYKDVPALGDFLKDISDFGENTDIKSLLAKWNGYKSLFEQYNTLMENCIVTKILSSCVSEDIEDMTISFQMIILEYLLVRYAVFLKYCMNKTKEINIKDLKDYIAAFSRIIGNNTEAVIEFLKYGFEEPILEIGYLCFITFF